MYKTAAVIEDFDIDYSSHLSIMTARAPDQRVVEYVSRLASIDGQVASVSPAANWVQGTVVVVHVAGGHLTFVAAIVYTSLRLILCQLLQFLIATLPGTTTELRQSDSSIRQMYSNCQGTGLCNVVIPLN